MLFSVQYAVHLYGHLKEWRKNPHWSFSCCLALLLPLINLPGEISGLVGTNITNTQLDTGQFEMQTVVGAVKDSGVIDVTLDDEEQDDDKECAKTWSTTTESVTRRRKQSYWRKLPLKTSMTKKLASDPL